MFYKTKDASVYQELLPHVFTIPDEPMVMAFVKDYYHMDKATEPYKEAVLFLLVQYDGKPAWYCVTMPVTSNEARIGGILFLGYPKIMGVVTLERRYSVTIGILRRKGKTLMKIIHDAGGHVITNEEQEWFEKLKDIPILNILNGKVFRPKFVGSRGQFTLLEIAEAFPEKFQIKVGKAELFTDPEAAGAYFKRLARIFSLRPTEIFLTYYFKNKFTARFEN